MGVFETEMAVQSYTYPTAEDSPPTREFIMTLTRPYRNFDLYLSQSWDIQTYKGSYVADLGIAFEREAGTKEKGKGMKLRQEAILIADRWDRVFLIASQLRYYNVYLPLAGFSGWNDEELIRKAGDALAGAVFSVDYADAIPGIQGEKLRTEYREAMRSAPSRFEAMGYDGAMLLAEAYGLSSDRSM